MSMIWLIILIIFVAYLSIVFVLSRFLFPFLGFKKTPLPDKLPKDMEKTINKIKGESHDKNEFLKKSYEYLTLKYHGERLKSAYRFDILFLRSIDKIWKRNGYIPCMTVNHILRIFLVRSGFFKEKEIVLVHMFFNFWMHQYIKVKVNNKWINVDVFMHNMGIKFGRKLPMFH